MAEKFQIEEYNYYLPEDRIAKFPLEKREQSKLLVYNKGEITESRFKSIIDHLPENSLLLFNDTKVIAARLIFYKETGARIEIFLLEPVAPFHDFAKAMEVKKKCIWKCTIGNKKKWKAGTNLTKEVVIGTEKIILKAGYENIDENLVEFEWEGSFSFAEIIDKAGKVPIPPYLERDDEDVDKTRYQTVFSKYEGAVAAPTAGLHFTDEIIASLKEKNISHDFVTLHVSAGTFKPVQSENYLAHDMHKEQIIVNRTTLQRLINAENIICVGTTSLRTLESLYWMGVKNIKSIYPFNFVEKLFPYSQQDAVLPSAQESLNSLLTHLILNEEETLSGETEIFIFPKYEFRMCKGLITNFHLPKSTLLLLIAAFIGPDWKKVYETALKRNFRFLSYGDSSFLIN